MIAALDVHYEEQGARTACVLFETYASESVVREFIVAFDEVAGYQPGAFYKRELPHLLRALEQVPEPVKTVLVDGYVWLDDQGRAGLGKHLHGALLTAGREVSVVGVAKRPFQGSAHARPVVRGAGKNPLYVTSEGVSLDDAAAGVMCMHGAYRIPSLLRRVDALCRGRVL